MSTTSIFHCINVPCNGWCGSRSLSVGGGGGVHKKSQINRRMIHSNLCHRFLSKTVKNNQTIRIIYWKLKSKTLQIALLKDEIKGSLDKWSQLCYQLRIINLFIIFDVSKW